MRNIKEHCETDGLKSNLDKALDPVKVQLTRELDRFTKSSNDLTCQSNSKFSPLLTGTHTHTPTHIERERERERAAAAAKLFKK